MPDLRQMILNELDQVGSIESDRLSRLAGYNGNNSVSNFRRALRKEDGKFANFNGFISVVKELFGDRYHSLLCEFALTVNPNTNFARNFLEYTNSYRLDDVHDCLIEKLSNSSNDDSKEWAKIYKINRQADQKEISYEEAIEQINKHNFETNEMRIFGNLVRIYAYYELQHINILIQSANYVEKEIKEIEDDFIRECFLSRLGLIMTTVSLHKNNLKDTRKYGDYVLSHSDQNQIKTLVNLQIGNSYLFESFEKAMYYFNIALEICEQKMVFNKKALINIKRSINFTQNYWYKKPEYIDFESKEVSDIHEKAFFYIRNGEEEKGLSILESMNLSELTNMQLGFHYFYRGLATNDINFYYKSISNFNKSGDRLYKTLSIIELQRAGVNENIIEICCG